MGAEHADQHLEVERKFAVAESTAAPAFEGLSPIADVDRRPPMTLDAMYFDTPGRDLAAHHITLRRRSGGDDAGWHLKLPAGSDTRTEIRMPPHTDGVPDPLREVVSAIVRNHPLAPIAHVSTHRTVEVLHGADGIALAEFCDDRVTASADGDTRSRRWREWELELAENAVAAGRADHALLQRLSERLGSAGAQPAHNSSKLAHALGSSECGAPAHTDGEIVARHAAAEQFRQLLIWDCAVRAGTADSIHRMRVTIRTIRSLLQTSGAAVGLSADDPILHELRAVSMVLGVARDAEVLADRYQRALRELPPALIRGPIRDRLVGDAQREYRAGLRKSLSMMRSQRYFRLLDTLRTLVESEGPDHEQRTTKAAIEVEYHRLLHRRAEAAATTEPHDHDVALHSIRKSAKRLRYAAAASDLPGVVRTAKAVQTVLGDHHDSVISRAHLLAQADTAHHAGEDTFTYGLLHEREAVLAQRCEHQLDSALHALGKAVHKARLAAA